MHKLTDHLFAETKYAWANVGVAVTEQGVVFIEIFRNGLETALRRDHWKSGRLGRTKIHHHSFA